MRSLWHRVQWFSYFYDGIKHHCPVCSVTMHLRYRTSCHHVVQDNLVFVLILCTWDNGTERQLLNSTWLRQIFHAYFPGMTDAGHTSCYRFLSQRVRGTWKMSHCIFTPSVSQSWCMVSYGGRGMGSVLWVYMLDYVFLVPDHVLVSCFAVEKWGRNKGHSFVKTIYCWSDFWWTYEKRSVAMRIEVHYWQNIIWYIEC